MAFKLRKRKDNQTDITTSKVYIFFDWIWKLFVLNTLTLVCSLGIITILPSLVSCFRTVKDIAEEDETHYIKKYFANFAYCFKDTVGLGILLLVIFALFAYSYVYYSELIDALRENGGYTGWLNTYSILLGFTMIFFLIIMLAVMQIPMVVTYFHFRFFDKIRFSFYMAYRYLGKAVLEVAIIIIDVLLLAISPIWLFFMFFSLPSYFIFIITRRTYWVLANTYQYDDYEEDEYDMQGKSQNRETYEDDDEKDNKKIAEKNLKDINDEIAKDKK